MGGDQGVALGSEEYQIALAQAAAHHAAAKTYSGRFLRPHKPWLTELIWRLGVTSILDYGCGKGEQYRWVDPLDGKTLEEAWGVNVEKFDPAWPPYAAEPTGQFDLVICTHVLGGIPLADHQWVLDRIFGLARKAVFIAEKIGPVRKDVHGDREGMHKDWTVIEWLEDIAPHRRDDIETHLSVLYRSPHGKFTGRFQI
jgi:hypothetical protein